MFNLHDDQRSMNNENALRTYSHTARTHRIPAHLGDGDNENRLHLFRNFERVRVTQLYAIVRGDVLLILMA
jgi:hypothetical protein